MRIEVLQLLVGRLMLENLQLQGELEDSRKSLASFGLLEGLRSSVPPSPWEVGSEPGAPPVQSVDSPSSP